MNKLAIFLIILFLTWINVKSYWHAGFPYTHDGENHLARFANYKIALREGQFPPRFAPNLLNHYGYPVFDYNYPLANILSIPFSILKINYELTFKILVISFVLFGLYGLNHWLRKLNYAVFDRVAGLLVFGFSPFLINLINYRGNIGEITSFCLFPWLLWLIEKIKEKQSTTFTYLWMIMLFVLFLLSHNISVMFGLPLIFIYTLVVFKNDYRSWKKLALVFGYSLCLSLWFWLPSLAEKSFVILDSANLTNQFTSQFVTLDQLLFSPIQFGFSSPGSIDSLSFSLGILAIFVILVFIASQVTEYFKTKKWHKNLSLLLLVLLLIIFQLQVTQVIWTSLPLVKFIQFPWRLSLFLYPFLSLMAAEIFMKGKTKLKIFFFLLVAIAVLNWLNLKPVDYFHRQSADYDAFSSSTSTANENLPKSFTFEYFQDGGWQPTAKVITGQGEVSINSWNGSKRYYQLNLVTDSTIVEPTMYFPGWQTLANGKQVKYVDDQQIRGRIAYQLAPGEYLIETKFTEITLPRIIGDLVSIFALTFGIGYLGFVGKLNLRLKKKS